MHHLLAGLEILGRARGLRSRLSLEIRRQTCRPAQFDLPNGVINRVCSTLMRSGGATVIGRIGNIRNSPCHRRVAVQLASRAQKRAHLRTVSDRTAQMPGVRGHIRGHVIVEGLLVSRVRSGDGVFRLVAFHIAHRLEPVEQFRVMFAAADGDI